MDKDPMRELRKGLAKISEATEPLRPVQLRLASLQATMVRLARIMASIPQESKDEAAEILARYQASRDLPEGDQKRQAWEIIGDLTPRSASKFWKHLPDPRARRGRRKGSKLANEIERAVAAGEDEAAVIARLVGNAPGAPKHRRDYLRRLRKRGKK